MTENPLPPLSPEQPLPAFPGESSAPPILFEDPDVPGEPQPGLLARYALLLSIAGTVLALDQSTKWIIRRALPYGATWTPLAALRWLALASVVAGYFVFVLWHSLSHNHRPGETGLLPTLGWGNALSLTRALLVAAAAGFVAAPRPGGWLAWLPGMLYTLGCKINTHIGKLITEGMV